MAYPTIGKIRELNAKARVFAAPEPLRSRQLIDDPTPPLDADLLPFGEAMAAIEPFLSKLSVTVLPQPLETIDPGLVTKAEYCTGSFPLEIGTEKSKKKHLGNDIRHMNAEYGKLFLETYLPVIRAA